LFKIDEGVLHRGFKPQVAGREKDKNIGGPPCKLISLKGQKKAKNQKSE
jgi:hypothetical protein